MSYKQEIKDMDLNVFLYYMSIYFIDGNIFYTVYDIL